MFQDVSHRIRNNPPRMHYGVSAMDFDRDGQVEFVVAGYGGPNRVLRWDGNEFWDIAPKSIADAERTTITIVAGDLDGDGYDELYSQNSDTFSGTKSYADRLFDHDPTTGLWSDLFARPINKAARNVLSARSVAVLDRRGTGRYSFAVANYDRPLRLYELSADGGQIVDLAPPLGINTVMGGRALWAGPLMSDRADLLCCNENGDNRFFRNTTLGSFLELATELNLHDTREHARGVTVLDANNDGKLDVCWGNWEGLHRLMIRQPDGKFLNTAPPVMAMPSMVRTVIAADFDNCGYEELFFNNMLEPNRVFRQRDGDWKYADVGEAILPMGTGTGGAIGDVDGDGTLELLLAHGEQEAQPLSLFKVPNENHWLRVAPLTRFGAPARGALVRVRAGGRTQVRVICGGSGYLCQMEPVAHIGLGSAERVDSVRIQWPDGATMELTDLPARQTLTVPYPYGV
jgi:ASPIC and UnbV/FG-GAP-like repeat